MHEIVHVLSSDFFQYNNKLPNNPSINIGCGHFLIYKRLRQCKNKDDTTDLINIMNMADEAMYKYKTERKLAR